MAESNSKFSAPLQKFAKDLRETLIRTETAIREMRAREASTKERKLEKHELCPLCGGPEVNARCKCIDALQKNAIEGYGVGAGGDPAGMAMSEMGKNEMCKNAGCYGGKHMDKCDLSEVKRGKDIAKSGTTPHLDEVKPGKMTKHMPSSSAGALSPPKARPATPVAAANKELGGFKSLVHSPTAMPAAAGPGLAPGGARKPLAHMGRPGVGNSATSGMIPQAKGEKNYGSARSPYGTGGKGHATQENMPSNLKANMAATKKAELPVVNAEPEKAVKGAKAPKKGTDETASKQGSGGEIKKGSKLAKAAPALAAKAPAGKGVPGKQPVGQGGGDAHKTAATAKTAALPKPGGNAVTKPVPGKLKAAGAADVSRMKGNANVQQLRGDLANVAAAKAKPTHPDVAASLAGISVARADAKNAATKPAAALPSEDIDVSDFDAGPAAPAAMKEMVHPNVAAARAKANPLGGENAIQNVRDQMNLAADKKAAGGVGFLRGLFSMFHTAKPSGQPTGRGMKPAPGVSVDQAVRQLGGNNGNVTRPTDSSGGVQTAPARQQQGLTSSKRFHGALPLQRGEMDMRKAALSLTKASDLDDPELDKGLSGVNHNRTMLSVTPKRRSKKTR